MEWGETDAMEAAVLEGRRTWRRGGEEACSSHHGVGAAATMECGERDKAAAAEKKRANDGGAVEAPTTANASLYFISFLFWRNSVCGLGAGRWLVCRPS
jgi:hypothetical protein